MSKLIESLKASAREFSRREMPGEPEAKKSNYELTQQQLADIYFSSSEKLRKSDQPLVIKVIEKQRPASILPWMIASTAFLLMAFSLFSTKRVFIDIKVVDEKYPYSSLRGEADSNAAPSFKEGDIKYGDKLPMQEFVFEGAAKLQSSKDKSGLTLVNSSVAPFARGSLYFQAPMNLRGSKIVFYAKGGRGGENVAFSVKDKENISAFAKGRIFPFQSPLTTDWRRAEIPLFSADGKFDDQNVASLRFDIGSKDTENKPGDTIFIRDLQIVPV